MKQKLYLLVIVLLSFWACENEIDGDKTKGEDGMLYSLDVCSGSTTPQ